MLKRSPPSITPSMFSEIGHISENASTVVEDGKTKLCFLLY